MPHYAKQSGLIPVQFIMYRKKPSNRKWPEEKLLTILLGTGPTLWGPGLGSTAHVSVGPSWTPLDPDAATASFYTPLLPVSLGNNLLYHIAPKLTQSF